MDRNVYELDVREHPVAVRQYGTRSGERRSCPLIRDAIAKLNANQQKVIELAYYEGLSQTEMAKRMGQPLGTVKTWVRAALRAVREELGQAVAA